ncbi:MAG: class I SAM-dependent methyltransferase [Bacteroidetes bacterium]|nr:class I SAM-dependent methyltransferase [Bacteroidota bacterium]
MIGTLINRIIGKAGYRMVKMDRGGEKKKGTYIDCRETLWNARKNNLSVGDYVEKMWNQVGATQKIIDNISRIVNPASLDNILEIGPGTGRYLDKIIKRYSPKKYVIYETDEDWSEWLGQNYSIIARQADGRTLSFEEDDEFDLVQAHGLFVYLPFLHSFEYFNEMMRVTKKDGIIVFDFFSSETFDKESINKWLSFKERYPVVLSAHAVKDYFAGAGLSLIGNFTNPYGHGLSTYHVYKKNE